MFHRVLGGSKNRFESYATSLFNHWKIGNRKENDGVMLLVAKADRKVRIELGAGYGSSMNRSMKQVIDHTIVPEFKRGAFGKGIYKGTFALASRLSGQSAEASAKADNTATMEDGMIVITKSDGTVTRIPAKPRARNYENTPVAILGVGVEIPT